MIPVSASRSSAPRRPITLLLIALLIGLAAAGGGIWYLFLRPSGPAPVAIGAQPSASAGAPAATTPPAVGGTATGGLDGTWSVDPSVGSFSDFTGSFAGYRVKETLANIGATTAVGRTPDVTGSITLQGSSITAGEFSVNVTTLVSDQQFRDGQLKRQALQTDQFPTATFTLAGPLDLGAAPADGATITVTAAGDLTLHGQTRRVEIPLQALVKGDVVTVTGSLDLAFADFGISQPQSMMVLSVEDHGILELQLQLRRP